MRATSLLAAFLALASVWHCATAVDAGGLRSAATFSSSANNRVWRSAASLVRDFLLWPLSQMGNFDGGINDGEDYYSHAYPLFGIPQATALDDNVLFLFALSGKALEHYKKKAANQRQGCCLEEQYSTRGEDNEGAAHEDKAHEMVVHVTYLDICECCLSLSISFNYRVIV